MKTFNETMVKNYREFNNGGTFEIEGYVVKFNNNTKTLETEYQFAKELKQLEKIYNCEAKDAQIYFDEIGMIRTWNQLTREMWAMGSAF